MAKRVPRKKVTRRLKRSVRKSLAAVLMITAIVVAAIPVPETYADNGQAVSRAGIQPRTDGSYSYDDNNNIIGEDEPMNPMDGWGPQDPNWDKESNKNTPLEDEIRDSGIYRTFSITKLTGDGGYRLDWQFKFYQVQYNNSDYGVVCDYNDTLYQDGTIEMQESAIYDYEIVTSDDYRDFWDAAKHGNDIYVLEVDSLTHDHTQRTRESWRFFQKYYPDVYDQYMQEFAAYQAAWKKYNDWIASGRPDPAPGIPDEPAKREYTSSMLSDEDKLSYYCYIMYEKGEANNGVSVGSDYTLKSVIDGRGSNGSVTDARVYIPFGGKPTAGSDLKNDSQGFMVKNTTFLLAIGDRAFADTTNVENMIVSPQIKFIGNEAFKNSFIRNINLGNVENIGNRAFYGCNRLQDVTFGNTVKRIGNEAFFGSTIPSVVLPDSITLIGGGAFANCTSLKSVDASALKSETPTCEIRDYAFFNDVALDSVDFGSSRSISKMGKGVFAVDNSVTGNLTEFTFPHGISEAGADGMGDYILAGRTNLETVTMPKSFGTLSDAKVPNYTFYNCNGLKAVIFPAGSTLTSEGTDCGYAYYDYDIFAEVATEGFYVQGPELNNARQTASPRKSTWTAKTMVADTVPYVYYKNGKRYCEVSTDNYLMSITEDGTITSIGPRPGESVGSNIDLTIKEEYGGIPIKNLADGCIDPEILKELVSLTIADNSIEGIGDNVFKGCPKLEKVVVGNAVKSIGAEAFAECPKLIDVTFHPPLSGYANFTIGQNAFLTGSGKLMFHGDIVEGYAPFEWAMDKDVYANEREGIRIAYQGLAPSRLTVLLDNSTLEPTLVDYQHYNLLDKDNAEYVADQYYYYELAASTISGDGADAYRQAWEDFKDECAAFNTDVGYSVVKKYEDIYLNGKIPYYDFEKLSPFEESLVDATKNVVVPEGVKSIDVYGFYTADTVKNSNSIAAYKLPDLSAWDSYTNKYASASYSRSARSTSQNGTDDVVPGLFSGNYQDYQTGSELGEQYETQTKGNDRIESIALLGVKKLPDYAFDDCERLKQVVLGADCTDIGTSPFRGCTGIDNVVFSNDIYTYQNGIIYKANAAGKQTIVTCLSTRGNGGPNTGEPYINLTSDPMIANVNEIAVGAFDSCENIANVDFSGAESLTEIPRGCFKNCTALTYVTLPKSVARIDEEAFYKDNETAMSVTILGKEVSIRNNAFNHSKKTQLRSYKDSAAQKYADTYGLDFVSIDEGWEVNFMDYDGTFLSDVQYIEDGKPAAVPNDPIRKDYTFIGWSPTVPGMSTQNITADVTFIAQYKSKINGGNGSTDPNDPNNSNNQNNKEDEEKDKGIYTVTVINGSGSGTYEEGKTVNITANAPSTGRKFDRWETSSLNVSIADVKKQSTSFKMPKNNVVVTAVYDGGNSSTGTDSNTNGGSSGSTGSTSSTGSSGTSSNGSTGGSGTAGTGTGTTPATAQNGTIVSIPNGIGVSNTGTASATVDGSTDNFVVRITSTPEATAAVERALTNEFGTLDNIRYFPMDITLYDSTGTTPITDTTGLSVNITMPIPDDLITYAGNNKAGAVVNGDTLEKLNATFKTIDGIPCINFTATHFSPYTIYVDTQNLTAAMDASPKTGDPIHPKWFLAMGLACLSVVLFMKKDKKSAKLA